ncbi:hypothetical protein Ate02nite_40110 [Paractinoplanes tereljensis]|uniref:N-acetyltransferase domain-containing protein n=1 Tax=Paractinoplanes tereljensis TaxID=571912 RepID=A0A919NNQ4_9ACTN|nr:hypothetical protein Ate02nite_40110 [Actinoplanes tereljensis]
MDGAGLDGAGLDGAGLDGAGLDGAGLDGAGPIAAGSIPAGRAGFSPIAAGSIPAGWVGFGSIAAGWVGSDPLEADPAEANAVGADLIGLAERCLRADGGMPLAIEPWFLRRRWAAPEGVTFALRPSEGGPLLAAGAVCPSDDGVIVTGLVDPDARGRGLGARVLDHGLLLAGDTAVTIETESLTDAAAALFESRGFKQVFAEDIMRIALPSAPPAGPAAASPAAADLTAADPTATDPRAAGPATASPAVAGPATASPAMAGPTVAAGPTLAGPATASPAVAGPATASPAVAGPATASPATAGPTSAGPAAEASGGSVGVGAGWADGLEVIGWSGSVAERFYAVYTAAFRERPGFPGESAAEWIAEYDDDEEFRAEWSVLVSDSGGDLGFVTAALGWIVQVGVVPRGRGRGIGAALVREALGRMAADGAAEAWLNVNVNNPGAAALYRRLGFVERGRRARFRRIGTELAS